MPRYIDTDAFDEKIRVAVGFAEEELTADYKDGIRTTLELLKAFSTTDVRENIRGEWKAIDRASGVWACSVCGWSVILHSGTPLEQHCNFCTNCGADMRKYLKHADNDTASGGLASAT